MKKLKLTAKEWEEMLKDISSKYHNDCKMNINSFEYTKKDITEFLKNLANDTITKPTLMISSDAYIKMYELVKQSPVEIQWHMLVKRDQEINTYYIYDILLFPQTNSGTATTTDDDEFAKWQTELIANPDFPIEELRGHGHSHVNMNVYSSGIDDAYQRDLLTKVKDDDFYIFLVLNKRMDMYALIYDFAQQMIFETGDINLEIVYCGEDLKAWCTKQISKYCKSASAKSGRSPFTRSYSYPDSYPDFDDEEEYIKNLTASSNFKKRRK